MGAAASPEQGKGSPALPVSLPGSGQQQVPPGPDGTSSPQYPTSPGEKGDIQWVFESSWCGWGPLAKLGRVPQGAQPRAVGPEAGQRGDTTASELKAR